MKLNKKTMKRIKAEVARYKQMYETPRPEVDKIIAELKEEAKTRPKNMSKDEEIAYIFGKDTLNEINVIFNERI